MDPGQAVSIAKLILELLPKPLSPKSYIGATCFPVGCSPFLSCLSVGKKEGEKEKENEK